MGGFVGDIVDNVTDTFHDIVDVVSDAANDMIKAVEDVTKFIADVSMSTTGIKWLDEQLTGGLIYNTVMGTIDNISGVAQGAVTGDWVQLRNSALGVTTTAIAVAAIVVGVITGQWWAVAAGVVVLDAQHNQGELLRRTIDIAAGIETAVSNTHYIEEYAVEIQMLLTVAASITAGYFGGGALMDWSGLSAAMVQWKDTIVLIQYYGGIGYGTYQIYSAVASIRASQAYWEEQLRAYENQLREWMTKAQAAREQWFNMMTNPNLINRIMPGGDLYSMGAGHALFSVTSVAEPKYALGLSDESDSEMDRMMNNRYFVQHAGNDAFKPQ